MRLTHFQKELNDEINESFAQQDFNDALVGFDYTYRDIHRHTSGNWMSLQDDFQGFFKPVKW